MSFHSMQAAWQALQPMQVDTSISLATSVVCRTLGAGVVVAERRAISSDCNAMSYPP
jgi:homoserine acetyltransferase